MRADNQFVLAGIEAVYGVAETLTGANAIQCDLEITPMKAEQKTREFSRPEYGARPVIHTEVHRAVKLSNIELAGSGDPAVAPAWAPIMRACGWSAVTTATETTFQPVTNAVDSLTLNPVTDTELFQMIGARGSLKAMFEVGEFPKLEADFWGGWVDVATLGSLPTLDFSDWQIPHSVNCDDSSALTIDGQAYAWYSLSMDQGSELQFYCVPGENGSRIELGPRQTKGVAKLKAKESTLHDLFALAKSNALVPLSMLHGPAAGSRVGLSGPKVQILNPRMSNYKSDLAYEVDLLFTPDTGDDEVVITTP